MNVPAFAYGEASARGATPRRRRRPGFVALGIAALAGAAMIGFVVKPIRVASGSMRPTLEAGDHVLASAVRYGLRLPLTRVELLRWAEPRRGDVVVFRFPLDPRRLYVKRVVGIPGDTVEMRGGALFLGGAEVATTPVGTHPVDDNGSRTGEEQTGSVRYRLVRSPTSSDASTDALAPRRIPADHYFVLGDRRDDSDDSRAWGFVSRDEIVGKAEVLWLASQGEQPGNRRAIDWARSVSLVR